MAPLISLLHRQEADTRAKAAAEGLGRTQLRATLLSLVVLSEPLQKKISKLLAAVVHNSQFCSLLGT